jgi:CheY-like chemotaxis protein
MGRDFHILVIEDDRDVRDSVALFLELEGYTVTPAAGGPEALALLEHPPYPHVILLDLNMPVMTGDEFRQAQRADARIAGIPVLVMSADIQAPSRAEAMGAAAFLGKPIDVERLMAALATLDGQHRGSVK